MGELSALLVPPVASVPPVVPTPPVATIADDDVPPVSALELPPVDPDALTAAGTESDSEQPAMSEARHENPSESHVGECRVFIVLTAVAQSWG
jgi:hypothetical protein